VRLYSIGHGTRSLDELVGVLAGAGVAQLVDVRSFPGSRRHPQFGREALASSLPSRGVGYHWLPELGGRRKPGPSPSRNPSWRVEAFRNYADYMDAGEFARGIDRLLEIARASPTAFMCAERHWSQCHRRLIADKLWSLGHEVVHLVERGRAEPHAPPDFLRVDGERLRYDR